MTVCPFCLTIYASDHYEGDECPNCEVMTLVSWEDFQLRMNSSFMESVAKENFINDPTE